MIRDLLAHKDYLRVLHAVAKTPKRFGALQRELKLNPVQVDRAVKFLSREKLIALGLADTATWRALMVYRLTKRGPRSWRRSARSPPESRRERTLWAPTPSPTSAAAAFKV